MLAAVLALACGTRGNSRSSDGLPETPDARALFSVGRTPIVTGWEATPSRLESDECASCHASVHVAWRESLHARAWTDPVYLAAYEREPLAWCRNCHAPLDAQESGAVARAEGVSCAACHVRDGVVVGVRPVPVSSGAHEVRAVAGFDGPELCAGCHQFNFPEATGDLETPDGLRSAVHYSDQPMQDTIAEARAAGSGACSTCHSGGHRWMASDTTWLARQFGEGQLESDPGVLSLRVEIAPRGHALPTGDPFRAMHLEVALDEAFERVWFRQRYGREFDGRWGADGTFIKGGQSRDTRIPAGRAAITTSFDRPPVSRVFARLRLFLYDRWVSGQWTSEPATAKVVWRQSFELEPELP